MCQVGMLSSRAQTLSCLAIRSLFPVIESSHKGIPDAHKVWFCYSSSKEHEEKLSFLSCSRRLVGVLLKFRVWSLSGKASTAPPVLWSSAEDCMPLREEGRGGLHMVPVD